MKLATMLMQRISNLVDRSLKAFENRFSNETHAVDLSSYYTSLSLEERQAVINLLKKSATKSTSLESANLQYKAGAKGTSFISTGTGLFIVGSSRANIDNVISSIGLEPTTLGYVGGIQESRPSPTKERVSRVLKQLPLEPASKILEQAALFTKVPSVSIDLDVSQQLQGTAILTFITDPRYVLSKQVDANINKAVREYIRSDKFIEDISRTDYISELQKNVSNNISSTLTGTTPVPVKKIHSTTTTKLAGKSSQSTLYKAPKLRNLRGQFASVISLQDSINKALAAQIQRNMGTGERKDILNYRTGRFAESAEVVKITQGRAGMLTAYYNYMKYPYQTFEPGFKQGSPSSRNPRLLISKSIREIAATQVANRMRAVLV